MTDCIFCKIINKSINSTIIYEDEEMVAFNDIHPKANIHLLLIPKLHIESMLDLNTTHITLMGKLLVMANELAVKTGLKNGYKINVNNGVNGGQEVQHLHLHILGNK